MQTNLSSHGPDLKNVYWIFRLNCFESVITLKPSNCDVCCAENFKHFWSLLLPWNVKRKHLCVFLQSLCPIHAVRCKRISTLPASLLISFFGTSIEKTRLLLENCKFKFEHIWRNGSTGITTKTQQETPGLSMSFFSGYLVHFFPPCGLKCVTWMESFVS